MTLKFRTTHVLVVAGLAATALTGCLDKGGNQQQAAATPQAVQVVVQQVELSDAIIRTDAPGRATAYQTAEVRPQVSGILQKRLFEEGAMVRRASHSIVLTRRSIRRRLLLQKPLCCRPVPTWLRPRLMPSVPPNL